ncbi:mesogenin-1-like [Pelobates fuscus]|uniref:mesogenin-1-like n=1 Tax=Pelobates fuscus TaxID=191477 RepID=UPI002FE4B9E0
MDNSSVPSHHLNCALNQHCFTLHQCSYPHSEGYSSLSPTSSTESCGLSPPYMTCRTPQDTCDNISACNTQIEGLQMDSACASNGKNKKGKVKLAHSQRQSASEREKLRMRTISKALQNLRRYLPPSVVPADKNLTKIETLQLTIRYISHLSAQLGLSEEVLEQRRLAAIQGTNRSLDNHISHMDQNHRVSWEETEQTYKSVSCASPVIETEHFPVDNEVQNTQGSRPMLCQVPQTSKVESGPPLYQYPAINTSLAQSENPYYGTDFQEMVSRKII